MKVWSTEIRAIDPLDGRMKTWCGPNIPAISKADAQKYCRLHLGFCKVGDEIVAEIPCKPNSFDPDFDNMIDYEISQNN